MGPKYPCDLHPLSSLLTDPSTLSTTTLTITPSEPTSTCTCGTRLMIRHTITFTTADALTPHNGASTSQTARVLAQSRNHQLAQCSATQSASISRAHRCHAARSEDCLIRRVSAFSDPSAIHRVWFAGVSEESTLG